MRKETRPQREVVGRGEQLGGKPIPEGKRRAIHGLAKPPPSSALRLNRRTEFCVVTETSPSRGRCCPNRFLQTSWQHSQELL